VVAQQNIVELGGQPSEGGPSFHEWIGFGIEPVEMIGDPQRIEVLDRSGQDIGFLIHDDRLVIAPAVADNRRQPAKS